MAGRLANHFASKQRSGLEVVLIESPDVSSIGVGEGTWPSMRTTLQSIGVDEHEFICQCDVSFKQGTRFQNWYSQQDSHYYHPFSLPNDQASDFTLSSPDFAYLVSPQALVCDEQLAPKQLQTPQYAFNLNYGYHLNATKFGAFLRDHCVNNLGVRYIQDHVDEVIAADNGDIAHLKTRTHGEILGDLFVDCSGHHAVLIEGHYQVGKVDVSNTLINNMAYALQVPYASEHNPIASTTLSTAQSAGWIWDIGLPNRRGVGYVCSSAHITPEQAQSELYDYLKQSISAKQLAQLSIREIRFQPSYRQQFWKNNCVAVGLSAGFVEPLEASALVLIERSATMLIENFPVTKELMPAVARKFNRRFHEHWQSIIQFLKLHYVLSKRADSQYWLDQREVQSVPKELTDLLQQWHFRAPNLSDFPAYDELFPAASYQYVLYGMGFAQQSEFNPTKLAKVGAVKTPEQELEPTQALLKHKARTKQLLNVLPSNRLLINQIHQAQSVCH